MAFSATRVAAKTAVSTLGTGMASITSVSATPTTVVPAGTSTITPTISNPDITATVTVALENSTGTSPIIIHETPVLTIDQTKIGARGWVVGSVDKGGTLAVNAAGTAFIFTAA